MRRWLKSGLVGCIGLLSATGVLGQLPGMGTVGTLNLAFIELFGATTTFTSEVEAQVLDKAGKEWARAPFLLQALDRKARLEIELGQIKSKELPEFAVETLNQAGLERIVSLILPDEGSTLLIYPGMRSFARVPLEKADATAVRKGYRVEKTPLGKENIDGHPCIKNKVVVHGPQGKALEALTWNAEDLKDFPIQIQTTERQNSIILRFAGLKFDPPDAGKFQPPSGYKEHANVQALMFTLMKRIADGGTQPGSRQGSTE